jgi:hypothetical protein
VCVAKLCARKGILPDCEIVPMDAINEVFGRLERADVRYRFVIGQASVRSTGTDEPGEDAAGQLNAQPTVAQLRGKLWSIRINGVQKTPVAAGT